MRMLLMILVAALSCIVASCMAMLPKKCEDGEHVKKISTDLGHIYICEKGDHLEQYK